MKLPRFVPAYLTMRPADIWQGAAGESPCFPFSQPGGAWTFNGRAALYKGIRSLAGGRSMTALVPSYCQGVEVDTLAAAGWSVRFYRLNERLEIDLEDVERRLDSSVGALYLIHYFGLPQPLQQALDLCRRKGIALVEDCALSLYSRTPDGIALGSVGDMAIFSLYKSLPLPHGGYLAQKGESGVEQAPAPPWRSTLFQTLDMAAQYVKCTVPAPRAAEKLWCFTQPWRVRLRGATPVAGDVTWDRRLLEYGVSSLVPALTKCFDPGQVIARRRANFMELRRLLAGAERAMPFCSLPEGCCPLFFPILVQDKAAFRRDLASRGIGSVNFWSKPHPACPEKEREETAPWRRSLLELPIHQQLDSDDMKKIAEAVKALMKGRRLCPAPAGKSRLQRAPAWHSR